ncbi:conserved protein of unknown function (plasmid) [Caballeronia sp. S22]
MEMDIEKIARDSGLLVVLDGRIGREEYKSVCGSLHALQRFADSVCELLSREPRATSIDRLREWGR